MKNTAWKNGDDEIFTVEKHEKEELWSKILFVVVMLFIAAGFSIQYFI